MSPEDYQYLLDLRNVTTPCKSCNGLGIKTYGSTATWHGGIGGSQITSDVCDKCWGSGDQHKHWPNWRELKNIKKENEKLKQLLVIKNKK